MIKISAILSTCLLWWGCTQPQSAPEASDASPIGKTVVQHTIRSLSDSLNLKPAQLQKNIEHLASLWRQNDGDEKAFVAFCRQNYVADAQEKRIFFDKVSRNLEVLNGHFNTISLELQRPVHEPMGPITPIDESFAAYSAGAHLSEDLYQNQIALKIALNFPYFTLQEKEKLSAGWNRLDWAYARLGDYFIARVPATITQQIARTTSEAEMYIAGYNIYAGNLLNGENQTLFPEEMVLLSHWNLRDEIKSNYSRNEEGVARQEMIYKVMQRIIDQTIPKEVINNSHARWNPVTNQVTIEGKEQIITEETDVRYQHILNNFKAMRQEDAFTPLPTAIDRAFEGGMEITQADAEALFTDYLSSPQLQKVGEKIAQRLGRPLQPWDIWYDGFKARASLNETHLNEVTRSRYPNAAALKADLPRMLTQLGFTPEKSNYLANKIDVDPANGSGHAWGAAMKGATAHLRTRIGSNGLDYKGYNIAIHEFGHNVEQTISLYDVDHYLLQGVPNTAFTEALAFLFQKRDLELLGMPNANPKKESLDVLDNFWSTYEIMGVSLLDQRMWKWMYANPNATAVELKQAVIQIAVDIWNTYYAPVFGIRDQPILAIYSHLINSPIYLSNYAFGQLIQFQVEQHLRQAAFAPEVERLYQLGRLTPNAWMIQGVGKPIRIDALIEAAEKAVEVI